ncbi:ISNCY family transposase [Acidithiobacillus ferrooxidans]|uniref:ISNCY family transposase n=1 Tax=Acidithiobacillus ferrooxidans TaxID=920 RepID=UPI00214AB774|nr:ISNCY family transposase [Acidithiobacillus ferrooxidans]MCR2829043.1 ISNCY family transposase [Acidithiobacillus ferrooxidans]
MRKVVDAQMVFGKTDISAIKIDPKSRDDIPRLMRGLQYIYTQQELRERVFAILAEMRPEQAEGIGKVSAEKGRPGMDQWKILVLGVMRLSLNEDYDRIHNLANNHLGIRELLGHGGWGENTDESYHLQTIKDNLSLFTPEILDRINQEVVQAGHVLLKKRPDEGLAGRCDSFVVETQVHYPTDINLLLDAVRKTIETCSRAAHAQGWTEWRQWRYLQQSFKKSYRILQKIKHSTAQDPQKRATHEARMLEAYGAYLVIAEQHVVRATDTANALKAEGLDDIAQQIEGYLGHARRQIDQIRRRVLQGEKIPHSEKVFSIFEPHTEWISKGKAGVPVELGLRVCIVEDQYRFILHHAVMEQTTDDQIAVPMVKEAQARFSGVSSMSFDKGFHSPANQTALREILPMVVLPKKGHKSADEKVRESASEFVHLRHQHSAVESAINALEQHGLDICPDHGITGFKRYVAMAVLARNIHRLGAVLMAQEAEQRCIYRKAA